MVMTIGIHNESVVGNSDGHHALFLTPPDWLPHRYIHVRIDSARPVTSGLIHLEAGVVATVTQRTPGQGRATVPGRPPSSCAGGVRNPSAAVPPPP